jgi:TP901 family phage tail tape measure protein
MDRKLSLIIQFAAADRLSGSLRQIAGLGDTGAQKLARMRREARELGRELASASGNVTELLDRERALERQMERQKRLLAIDNRVGRMQAQASAYRSAGQDNMVQGGAMLAPLVVVGKQAMDFSSGMIDLQQKAELTNAELVKMQGNILAAAKATHQLPENMRAAVDVLAGYGMDPRHAVQLAAPIGRLGTAFKVELADGAAAAYASINNLKVPLDQVAKTFDIMAEGGNAGAFEVKDMARWFPTLTAQMQALGEKGTPAVADLTAALQVAMNTAGSADEAGNNIANLLGKINSPTVINAFAKKFGVDLPAAMARARAEGKTTMEAFAEIATQTTGGDMTKLGWLVQDRQAQMGLLGLMQNMETYRSMRAAIGKADGTVQSAFSQRELGDASVQWQAFLGTAQNTAIVLGAKLLPAASQLMTVIGGVVGAVGSWAQANPRLAGGFVSLIGYMAVARIGLGALQFAFGSVLGPMATVWGWFQKLRAIGTFANIAGRAAQAFGMLRTAAIFLGQGFMRAGLMMLANPMVLIIAAIVVAIGIAGYLIYKHWDTIKQAFATGLSHVSQAWQMVKTKFGEGVDFLKTLPGKMLSIGVAIIQGIARGIMSAPGAVWSALKSVVMAGITNVKDLLGIKSPSRVFMGIGGHMTAGLALGVEQTARRPIRAVSGLAAGVAGAMALTPAAASTGGGSGSATASLRAGGAGGGDTYHLHIAQRPGENAEELARRVMELIDRKKRGRGLGDYSDA